MRRGKKTLSSEIAACRWTAGRMRQEHRHDCACSYCVVDRINDAALRERPPDGSEFDSYLRTLRPIHDRGEFTQSCTIVVENGVSRVTNVRITRRPPRCPICLLGGEHRATCLNAGASRTQKVHAE